MKQICSRPLSGLGFDMTEPAKPVEVYQLRVWIREISPVIWRRLLVRSDSTIADLHYTLQIALDWSGYHLHQFIIRGKHYGIYQPGGIHFLSVGFFLVSKKTPQQFPLLCIQTQYIITADNINYLLSVIRTQWITQR